MSLMSGICPTTIPPGGSIKYVFFIIIEYEMGI